MAIYEDLGDNPEDERIARIGQEVVTRGATVAFIVENEKGKADRYIRKLLKRFPTVRVIERFRGPLAGMETVKIGPIGVKNVANN